MKHILYLLVIYSILIQIPLQILGFEHFKILCDNLDQLCEADQNSVNRLVQKSKQFHKDTDYVFINSTSLTTAISKLQESFDQKIQFIHLQLQKDSLQAEIFDFIQPLCAKGIKLREFILDNEFYEGDNCFSRALFEKFEDLRGTTINKNQFFTFNLAGEVIEFNWGEIEPERVMSKQTVVSGPFHVLGFNYTNIYKFDFFSDVQELAFYGDQEFNNQVLCVDRTVSDMSALYSQFAGRMKDEQDFCVEEYECKSGKYFKSILAPEYPPVHYYKLFLAKYTEICTKFNRVPTSLPVFDPQWSNHILFKNLFVLYELLTAPVKNILVQCQTLFNETYDCQMNLVLKFVENKQQFIQLVEQVNKLTLMLKNEIQFILLKTQINRVEKQIQNVQNEQNIQFETIKKQNEENNALQKTILSVLTQILGQKGAE
ncbi:Hypothetical_protein [Hexamita inflata]|uniref:Hypothetical_protein n=1 Tax=Hexamita inflata TaxID=28002 RepID=A0AA86UK29_9EUKA|nr:Hypothetical protein HINF_LOCUS42076 [Hexamita inflata]